MNGSLKSTRIVILLLIAVFVFSSCGGSQMTLSSESESSSSSGTTTTPSDPTGQEDDPNVPAGYDVATEFFVTLDALTSYPHYVSQLNSYSDRCKITSGTTPAQDIDCVVEAPELGFYYGGAEIALNVPAGMCEYTRVTPYWYYNYEVGIGPEEIEIETSVNAEGNVMGYRCGVDGGALGSCGEYTEVAFETAEDTVTPRCIYDHSNDPDKPNCCRGTYDLVSTTITYDASGTSTTTTSFNRGVAWGGNLKSCVGGQGKTNWTSYSKSGLPVAIIYETRSQDKLEKYEINPPIDSPSGSNITIANYYTSTSTDPVVAVDEHTHTGFAPLNAMSSVYPYYVAPISDRSGDAITSGSPTYEFACLDDAYELKHRINLYLREWDTYAEYLSYVTTGIFAGTKPWDIAPNWEGGTEGADCSGLSPEVCNDYKDADNFVYGQDGNTYSTAPASATERYLYFPADPL